MLKDPNPIISDPKKLPMGLLSPLSAFVSAHSYSRSLRRSHHALIVPRRDIVERALEVLARVLQAGRVLVGVEVRVDELDEAVEVLCRDLTPNTH